MKYDIGSQLEFRITKLPSLSTNYLLSITSKNFVCITTL